MSKKSSARSGRDVLTRSLTPTPALPRLIRVSPVDHSLWSDRRLYHPLGPVAPAQAVRRSAAAVVVRSQQDRPRARVRPATYSPHGLVFTEPRLVDICVRRAKRKEVLFAKRKAGKSGQRKPKRNYWSSISCRR